MKKIDKNIDVGEKIRGSLSGVIEVGDGAFEIKYRAAGGAAQTVTWVVSDGAKLFLANGDLIRLDADGEIINIIGRAALATIARSA